MKHLGLFAGIGGFEIAARWAGWETLAWCEWDLFGQRVLKYHFPNAEGFGDITKTDFTKYANKIDILTGGFPCQPYSVAGKRLGKEDERHLWPEMLRAIREIKPRWVVGENVYGLVSWNGGVVFNEVQTDLENEGYEVQAYILPACAKNAPHRRDRVWFVAYANGNRKMVQGRNGNSNNIKWNSTPKIQKRKDKQFRFDGTDIKDGDIANGYSKGLERRTRGRISQDERGEGQPRNICKSAGYGRSDWSKFPIKPPVCGGDDGLPRELDAITFSKWRAESIKAYGNAIVPQIAYEIFKTINEYEKLFN